jgi:hypothetical protein
VAFSIYYVGASATIPYKARITIPQADLSFVSGTLYEFDTMAFWAEMKTNEEDIDGIVFNDLQAHNPDYTVAGINYADAVFMLCEVTFENTGSNYSVKLVGSNNDIFDEDNGILVATPGLTIIPTNAAGLIIVETADAADINAKLTTLLAAQDLTNEQTAAQHITDPATSKLILRNATVMRRWEGDAWEDAARTIPYRGRIDGIEESGGLEVVDDLVEVAWS